jgi:plastocyanin
MGLHVVALFVGATACRPEPQARHHEVVMRGGAFVPATLAVEVGDTVTWRNADPVPHTATGPGWDSGELTAGASFAHEVAAGDTGSYACRYHPTMTGSLRPGGT